MTTKYFFMKCVELVLTRSEWNFKDALRIYGRAEKVPEEAYAGQPLAGQPLEKAALDFVAWATDCAPEPAWLKKYEDRRRSRVCIGIKDAGCGFWDHARIAIGDAGDDEGWPFPSVCAPLFVNPVVKVPGRIRMVVVDAEDARLFEEWVKTIPGHEDEPFRFEKVGDDHD